MDPPTSRTKDITSCFCRDVSLSNDHDYLCVCVGLSVYFLFRKLFIRKQHEKVLSISLRFKQAKTLTVSML